MKARAGGINFSIPDSWSDVTLKQAIDLHKLCEEMPAELRALYDAIRSQDKDEITAAAIKLDEKADKNLYVFYGKVIKLLTDLDDDEIERLAAPARSELYRLMEWVVFGIGHAPRHHNPKGIKYFKHRGVKYYLPKSGKGVGMDVPGVDLSALRFTQSADFFSHMDKLADGAYDKMRYAIAILCLPKREKYDEQRMFDRAEKFEDLPMDVVWEVFFFINNSLTRSLMHTLNSFSAGLRVRQPQKKAGWLRGAGTVRS